MVTMVTMVPLVKMQMTTVMHQMGMRTLERQPVPT